MMHVGRGREHPLHVEYVHIGACLSFIQDTLAEALLCHPRLRMDKKIALVKALGKVIWIQNDLFAKWYVRDGDEFADDMEAPEVEREGYLHGKKMLDELDDNEEGRQPGVCPFTGATFGGFTTAGAKVRADSDASSETKEEAGGSTAEETKPSTEPTSTEA
jgi:hypothetical protein